MLGNILSQTAWAMYQFSTLHKLCCYSTSWDMWSNLPGSLSILLGRSLGTRLMLTHTPHTCSTHTLYTHTALSHFSFQSYSCWVTNWNSARLQETDHVVLQAVSDPAGRQHWWDGCHSEIQWVQERVQTKTNRGVLWWTQGRGLVSDFVISRGLFVGRGSCSCARVCVCVCVGVDTMFSVWQLSFQICVHVFFVSHSCCVLACMIELEM